MHEKRMYLGVKRMKNTLILILIALLILPLVACSQPAFAGIVKSEKPRITSPDTTLADEVLLVEGNSTFAFDLYQALRGKEGNLFFSPYSISLMMAMAFAGAQGQTAQQIADAMSYNLSPDELHAAFNYLSLRLAQRTSAADNFQLDIVNDIWGQKNYQFLQAYLDILAQNYSAGLRVVDFTSDPDGARKEINDYIYDQTHKLIKDLIPAGAINAFTRLVLTNAIYFKADWASKFNKNETHDGVFKLLDNSQVTLPMMNQRSLFKIASGKEWKAIELPYKGEQIAMDIILPDDFNAFEESLDITTINQILAAMDSRDVQLSMPKFKFASDFDLKEALSALGMPVAFDPANADFSGITNVEGLYIQGVVHKAFVAVDEEGTEAAAAGAVIIGTVSMPESFTVDSPFIFFIRDVQTGSILFMGRVLNPAS
jgi:serpin B